MSDYVPAESMPAGEDMGADGGEGGGGGADGMDAGADGGGFDFDVGF